MSGLWVVAMSELPLPGMSSQAGKLFTPTTRSDVQLFFERGAYHERVNTVEEPKKQQMVTTKENIKRFFNPATYIKVPAHSQKRSCPTSETPTARPKAKMSKMDLLEKFKLAAELNGVEWEDLAVTRSRANSISTFYPLVNEGLKT